MTKTAVFTLLQAALALASSEVDMHLLNQTERAMQMQTYCAKRSFIPELLPSDFKLVAASSHVLSIAELSKSFNTDPGVLAFQIYMASIAGLVILVSIMYFQRGFLVILRILAYLLALCTMTLTVKNVFVNHQFNFPKFVSCLHFMSAGIVCFSVMLFRRQVDRKKIPVPSLQQFCMILPIALTFASSIGANNLALVHSNAAFVEMVGSCTPICIVACNVAMGKGFDLRLLVPVLVVCFGIALCSSGEIKFSTYGFGLAFVSACSRAVRSTLQHRILDSKEVSLDPIELLAWMSPPSILVMLTWSVLTEGAEPFLQLTSEGWFSLALAIGVTCVNACLLNVANLFVLKDLGPVATQLAAQLKGVLVVLGGVAVLGESVQLTQVGGYTFVIVGVFMYNKIDQKLRDELRRAERKALDEKLQSDLHAQPISHKRLERTPLLFKNYLNGDLETKAKFGEKGHFLVGRPAA